MVWEAKFLQTGSDVQRQKTLKFHSEFQCVVLFSQETLPHSVSSGYDFLYQKPAEGHSHFFCCSRMFNSRSRGMHSSDPPLRAGLPQVFSPAEILGYTALLVLFPLPYITALSMTGRALALCHVSNVSAVPTHRLLQSEPSQGSALQTAAVALAA